MGFAENFKLFREKQGLSQEQLAEKLGIPRSTIAHYENSQNNRLPRIERLQLIANTFKVSVDKLLSSEVQEGSFSAHIINESVPVGTKEGKAVYDTGEQREISIYKLILTNKEEIFAPENIIGTQLVPADSIYTKGFKAIDNSMSGSQILTGTNALIEEDDSPFDGEIVVAQVIKNADLLIRRYTKSNDEVILTPDNSNYKPQVFRANEIRIIGIVTDLHTHLGRKSK